MISLRILEHQEGGADQLMAEVHGGSFHKLQAVLIHDNAHSILLKHTESRTEWTRDGTELIGLIDNKESNEASVKQ